LNIDVFSRIFPLSMILEASAWPKPGNVHRARDRSDLKYEAFITSGIVAYRYFRIGVLRGIRSWRRIVLGDLIYKVVKEAMDSTPTSNTCLGSSLLLIPLALGTGRCLAKGSHELGCIVHEATSSLLNTSVLDSIFYYKAIRKASPSYLRPTDDTGEYVNVWDPDYSSKLREKGLRLIDVLRYSSRIDVVAKEAINEYRESFLSEGFMRKRLREHGDWNRSVVEAYLRLLSTNLDTIVLLKHGELKARMVMQKAESVLARVLDSGDEDWITHVSALDDEFYKSNINPGAIADLTASTIALFLLRNTIEGKPLLSP